MPTRSHKPRHAGAIPAPATKRPFRVGDRVRVVTDPAPACRTGRITELRPQNGGALVKHDDGPIYGWVFGELELVAGLVSSN